MKRIIALCLIIFLSFSSGANAWWELEEFRTELERRLNEKRIGDEEFIQPLQRILGAPEAIEAVRGRDIDALNDIMLTQLVHMMPKQAHDVAEVLQEVMDAADPIPGPVAAGRGDDAPEPVRAGGQIASLIIYDVIKDIAPTLAERIYTYAEGDRQPLLEQHDRRRTEVVARIQKYLENPGNHYAILHGDVDHFINDVFPTSVSRDISPSERRHYERLVGQIKIHAYEEQSRRRKEEASERAAGAERARNARTPEEAYRQALTPRQLFSLGINKGLAAWQRLVSSQDNAGINLDDRQKMFYEDKLLAYARDPANYQHMRDLNGQHLKAYMEAQHPSSPNGQVPQIKLTVSDYRDLLDEILEKKRPAAPPPPGPRVAPRPAAAPAPRPVPPAIAAMWARPFVVPSQEVPALPNRNRPAAGFGAGRRAPNRRPPIGLGGALPPDALAARAGPAIPPARRDEPIFMPDFRRHLAAAGWDDRHIDPAALNDIMTNNQDFANAYARGNHARMAEIMAVALRPEGRDEGREQRLGALVSQRVKPAWTTRLFGNELPMGPDAPPPPAARPPAAAAAAPPPAAAPAARPFDFPRHVIAHIDRVLPLMRRVSDPVVAQALADTVWNSMDPEIKARTNIDDLRHLIETRVAVARAAAPPPPAARPPAAPAEAAPPPRRPPAPRHAEPPPPPARRAEPPFVADFREALRSNRWDDRHIDPAALNDIMTNNQDFADAYARGNHERMGEILGGALRNPTPQMRGRLTHLVRQNIRIDRPPEPRPDPSAFGSRGGVAEVLNRAAEDTELFRDARLRAEEEVRLREEARRREEEARRQREAEEQRQREAAEEKARQDHEAYIRWRNR